MNIVCRDYQTQFINDIKGAIKKGCKRIIACASTGSGKSIVLASIAKSALGKRKRIIIMLPRRSLVLQLSATFDYYKINHGVVMAGEPQFRGAMCQIVSIDTYVARLASGKMSFIDADILCLDEMHTQFTPKKLEIFGRYPLVIGFSATPIAPKNRPLNIFYQTIVESISMRELIKQEFLVPLKYFAPSDFHPDNIKLDSSGEYNGSALTEYIDEKLKDEEGNRVLVGDIYKNWLKLAHDRKTVIFCATQAHARFVTNTFIEKGVKALYVDCNTPDDERKVIFDSTANGNNQVIVNVGIIAMGIDIPILSCVVLARPTNSIAGYLQCVGRGTRPCQGKENCLVIDHCGIVAKLGFAEEEQYWDLTGKESPEERKQKAKEEAKEPKEITCSNCHRIFTGRRICPYCAYEAIPKGEEIPCYEAELVEIKAPVIKPEEKKKFYAQLLYVAQEKGYKRGWADHKFKARYKHYPAQKNSIQPTEPDNGLAKFMQHLHIEQGARDRVASK